MLRLFAATGALCALLVGALAVQAAPPPVTGPAVIDAQNGRLFVAAEGDDHARVTLVVSTSDGSVLSVLPGGGPMALDAARDRLYVSTDAGVVALDVASGQQVLVLATVPVKTGWGSRDFLPPVVVPVSGEVLVVDGPQVSVFPADSASPTRTLPFTAEGFSDTTGSPLTPQAIAFDEARGVLYGAFLVHSQVSSGIGGSFAAYEVYGLDVKSGQSASKLEAIDLNGIVVDPQTGALLVNAVGDARLWPGSGDWSAQLRGANLAVDQPLLCDAAARRVYARAADGPLLALSLDTLDLLGIAHVARGDRLLALDAAGGRLFFASVDGTLSLLPLTSLGESFAATAGDGTAPPSAVRRITPLPDGRLAAEWAGHTVGFSDDGAAHWTSRIAGAYALAVSPQYAADRTLLIALDGLGVFRSEDAGATWHVSATGLHNLAVDLIAFSPTYASDHAVYLYAATGTNPLGYPRAGELYGSTDGGRTWYALPPRNNGLETIAVSDACGDGCALAAVTAAGAAPGPGTFTLSTDGGAKWVAQGNTPAYPVPGGLSLAPLFGHWGIALLFGTDGSLYRTADSGLSWSAVLTGASSGVYWGLADEYAQIAYGAETESGRPVYLVLSWSEIESDQPQPQHRLFASVDGGQTWQRVTLPDERAATAIAIPDGPTGSDMLYAGLPHGGIVTVLRSALVTLP